MARAVLYSNLLCILEYFCVTCRSQYYILFLVFFFFFFFFFSFSLGFFLFVFVLGRSILVLERGKGEWHGNGE